MKKIVIPVDGSEYSERAIEKGKEIAKACGSHVILIHVKDVRFPLYPYEPGNTIDMGSTILQLSETASKTAQRILENAAAAFGGVAENVETYELDGDPGNRIIKFIEDDPDIDLVIMGSLGVSGGLQSFLLGSVTNKVLHHVDRPILVVK